MMLRLYKGLSILGGPLIAFYLSRRLARGKEDAQRFSERLGHPGQARPNGRLVWLHGASVGEALSLLPLIERLSDDWPRWTILVTTGTVTSARLMHERLTGRALHQYMPVDRPIYVKRFLDHWQPDLALWVESEFWPNMIAGASERKIPLVLLNGRVSPKSFKTWRRLPEMIGTLLSAFSLCLGQTEADAERLHLLGANNVKCVGNLKFASAALPVDDGELNRLKDLLGDRPRWLAASTHIGEEALIARTVQSLKNNHPDLLGIIAPRHPERGAEIVAELTGLGVSVACRSMGQTITADTDIYVADTLGELGLFYRLCPITLIGKSIIGQGGQNPLEPARLGSVVIMGPRMDNFEDIAATLTKAHACIRVSGETDLGPAVSRLLNDTAQRDCLIAAATQVATLQDGVLDAVFGEITPYLMAGGDHART